MRIIIIVNEHSLKYNLRYNNLFETINKESNATPRNPMTSYIFFMPNEMVGLLNIYISACIPFRYGFHLICTQVQIIGGFLGFQTFGFLWLFKEPKKLIYNIYNKKPEFIYEKILVFPPLSQIMTFSTLL